VFDKDLVGRKKETFLYCLSIYIIVVIFGGPLLNYKARQSFIVVWYGNNLLFFGFNILVSVVSGCVKGASDV